MLAWKEPFLTALEACPNVSAACKAAGISRVTAYQARKDDPDFAQRWSDALEASTDDLASEAYRRARHGCEKPVYQGGELVGTVREYSDTLAIFLLKSHRPEVYRESSKVELSGGLDLTVGFDAAMEKVYGGNGDPGPPGTT